MPTFYSRPHGTGIADSVRAMLSSSPNLSNSDIVKVGLIHAQTQQHTALAEKARQEIEAAQESARMRQDPALANEYASTTSGITVPQGRQLGGFIRGDTIAPATPVDDSGNVNAAAEYARPDVTQEQERGFRSAIGALIANRMATGKTNAEQLTQGGGNLLTQAIRSQISATPDVAEQNQLKAAIAPGYREPYSGGAPHGVAINQETGAGTVADPQLHTAAVSALEALATNRRRISGKTPAEVATVQFYADNMFDGDIEKASDFFRRSRTKSPEALYLDVRGKLANANPMLARDPAKLDQATQGAMEAARNFSGGARPPVSIDPMPTERSKLVKDHTYQTRLGPAKWNGTAFEAQGD